MPVPAISSHTGLGLSTLERQLFDTLNIVRVYTREPSATRPSLELFIIKKGTTVGELTRKIHSALFSSFGYARIWGRSVSYDGERVGIGHMLSDGDVLEIHA
jgi:ribosome-interacting GTPase 1